jgi:hypothetical protein
MLRDIKLGSGALAGPGQNCAPNGRIKLCSSVMSVMGSGFHAPLADPSPTATANHNVVTRINTVALAASGLVTPKYTSRKNTVASAVPRPPGMNDIGPVGGRIVGEVIIGLLEFNRNSYLSRAPLWKPTLPTFNGPVSGDFRMIDFLAFAGVDPASRGE